MALWNQPRRLKEAATRQSNQENGVLEPNWKNFQKEEGN